MIGQIRLEKNWVNGNVTDEEAKAVGAKMILIANDAVASDELTKKSILIQANPEFKWQFRGVEESIRLLDDPRADKLHVMIICNNPADIVKFTRKFKGLEVAVGKYKSKGGTIELSEKWIISEEEKPVFDEIDSEAVLIYQLMASRPKQSYQSLIKNRRSKV